MNTPTNARPHVTLEQERSQLSNNLGRALREIRSFLPRPSSGGGAPVEEPDFHWDAHRDTRYAHEIPSLGGLLHVFQQEWVGIRAAAGSLPGRKLAIKPDTPIPRQTIKKLVGAIKDAAPQRILMQGMSDVMGQLVDELAAQGMRDRLFVILHGAPSQWFSEPEARYAFRCLELARAGKIQRLHIMKAGFEFPEPRLYRPMLFNLPPRLSVEDIEVDAEVDDQKRSNATALIPGWSGWRKNIHTNALGAALSTRVKEVWAFGSDLALPSPLDSKLRIVPFNGREQTFDLIKAATLAMNVSLVDCHPMIHLEAQALGKVCLRGPLFLDALEDHPYVRLTEVSDVSSPAAIRDAVDRVLDVPPDERLHLVRDYQAANDRIALQRYREFLDL